ncbi:MAG: hypothetical protein JWP06_148 [Candidatus Saccharibacteria bacterium]|nr:hypothetical protein [Candidatus Saccharibacteria bacterium]
MKTKYVVYNKPYNIPIGAKDPTDAESTREKKQKHKNKLLNRLEQFEYLSKERSLRRTKTEIKDIILCNHFDLFATFTFNKDRQNVDVCKSKMQYWLQSQQKIHGKFDYLIVPEFHKDGVSIHFHALLSNYTGKIEDSGHKSGKTQKIIYNITSYRSGFSTATEIDGDKTSRDMVANYVTKYITKDMPQFAGKKRYWVSKGLIRPIKSYNEDVPEPDLFTDTFEDEYYTIHNFPKI